MSVDCTSNIIWGGVVSDSSDEDDVIISHHDVIASRDDVNVQPEYSYSSYTCGQLPYTGGANDMEMPCITWLNTSGSVYPSSNEQMTHWHDPRNLCDKRLEPTVERNQQQAGSGFECSNIFSRFDSEFTTVASQLDDLSIPVGPPLTTGLDAEEVITTIV